MGFKLQVPDFLTYYFIKQNEEARNKEENHLRTSGFNIIKTRQQQ